MTACLDPQGNLAGSAARIADALADSRAELLAALARDGAAGSTASTVSTKKASLGSARSRPVRVDVNLVNSTCASVGYVAGGVVGVVGTGLTTPAGGFAMGAGAVFAADAACQLAGENCNLVNALSGFGLLSAAAAGAEAGMVDTAGLSQKGRQLSCSGADAGAASPSGSTSGAPSGGSTTNGSAGTSGGTGTSGSSGGSSGGSLINI